MNTLGDSLSPTEASADILSRLQDYANINANNTDTKQLAVVAFLYVFCSIAPTNGWGLHSYRHITSFLPQRHCAK